jgi:gamma-glutamyltranspeptidase/glutathione hydrolase
VPEGDTIHETAASSPVHPLAAEGSRFAIATPHHLATRAGADAFARGGNALDAAVAAAVTLAVVYPHMCGVGGDLFALVRRREGEIVAVNASGGAPLAIDVDAIRRHHGTMPLHGPAPITVPGAVSGWHALWGLGAARPFAAAFEHGLAAARDGVPVSGSLARSLAGETDLRLADAGVRAVFAPAGRPLGLGARLLQRALARTLAAIAADGPAAVYGGDVGAALVRGLNERGSAISLGDLRAHQAQLVAPLVRPYRDLEVSVVPPNSQGFALLQILRAIERGGLDPDPLGRDAARLADLFHAVAGDRDRNNADPRAVHVDVDALLRDDHIDALLETADQRGTHVPARRPTGDTIALVAADSDGNAVSLIQSLYDGFGSGILEPSTGIVLHNRGSAFSLDPASPNVLAGGKRPAHTLMPVLVQAKGEPVAVSGSMGGGGQPQINAQNLLRALDLGLHPHEAIAAPRWLVGGMELNAGRSIDAESRVPSHILDGFARAGFAVTLLDGIDEGIGHAHLIVRKRNGTFEVGSDPRADGEAAAG